MSKKRIFVITITSRAQRRSSAPQKIEGTKAVHVYQSKYSPRSLGKISEESRRNPRGERAAARAPHRRASDNAVRHPAECASVPPDPTQLLQKAHSCDRHHIASAMAELVSCLSIIPHMRSFDVPPKLSPAHAGLFLRCRPLAMLRRRQEEVAGRLLHQASPWLPTLNA
jgi:hypothetical protein